MPRGRYFPAEYVALRLLEYMVKEEEKGPFSLYKLRDAVENSQRKDRLRRILTRLVDIGLVEKEGNPPRYRVTEKGKEVYPRSKEFLSLSRLLRSEGDRRDNFVPSPLIRSPASFQKKEVR